MEGLAAAADRVEAVQAQALRAEEAVGAEEEQGSATVDFAAARAGPAREAAEGDLAADLPTVVPRVAAIARQFFPIPARASREATSLGLVNQVQGNRAQGNQGP